MTAGSRITPHNIPDGASITRTDQSSHPRTSRCTGSVIACPAGYAPRGPHGSRVDAFIVAVDSAMLVKL